MKNEKLESAVRINLKLSDRIMTQTESELLNEWQDSMEYNLPDTSIQLRAFVICNRQKHLLYMLMNWEEKTG